ncbi:MAG: hypothetical protein ACU84J_14325 [Gammaproteobacteria bacterium]
MEWQPITETEIWDEINSAWERMSLSQRRLWETIRIVPEKWKLDPWGNQGDGFWVVGLIGNSVVWYNDIENGFNKSTFSHYGEINEYWCNQDELEWTIQHIINEINDGYDSASYASPPQPIA